jgi:hypothetical protein
VLAWAVRYGRRAGLITAVIMSACDLAPVRGVALSVALNGVVLLLLAGLIVGHLARLGGPGIEAGRLAEAAAAGRLGVSHSIRGRLRDLGGSATITSAPGEGTEVSLHCRGGRAYRWCGRRSGLGCGRGTQRTDPGHGG